MKRISPLALLPIIVASDFFGKLPPGPDTDLLPDTSGVALNAAERERQQRAKFPSRKARLKARAAALKAKRSA